jgi:hypothetical protein
VEYDAPQSVLHIKNAPQLQFLLAQFTINDGLKKKRVSDTERASTILKRNATVNTQGDVVVGWRKSHFR